MRRLLPRSCTHFERPANNPFPARILDPGRVVAIMLVIHV